MRRMRWMEWMADAALAAVLLMWAAALAGCAMTLSRTPIMAGDDEGTALAYATAVKMGVGSKESTALGAYKLSADGGLEISDMQQRNDASLAFVKAMEAGASLGAAAVLRRYGLDAGAALPDAAGAAGTAGAAGETAYSAEGYGGAPGAGGEGVYGRPSCPRCRAYAAAHPGVEIIDIDQPANSAAMWAALRARGYTGRTAALPVAVTAEGYALGAK